MTAALARRADAYLAIIRIGFLIPLAFRLFPFMMVLSYPITMTGNYFLYRAIYASQGNAPIAGLTMEQSITYILVGWTVRSFFNIPIARQIGERVKSGQIASDLIKPVDFFALMFCQGVGRCLHRLAFISGPLILMILFSRVVVMPQHPETYGFFLGSCLLGFFIHYAFWYLSGMLAFFFEYNEGLGWMLDLIAKLLGGLMLPLTFFPEAVVRVLKWLPFAGMYFQPAQIFLEKTTGPAVWGVLGQQALWALVLFGVGRLMFRLGERRLAVQGG